MDKLFDFFNWILPRLSWAAEGLGQFFGNLLRSIPYALSWLFANHVTIAELYCLLVRWIMPVLALMILTSILRSMIRVKNPKERWGYLYSPDLGRFPVTHWETLIGKGRNCDIVVPFMTISKVHCALIFDGTKKWRIHNLTERADVSVNGVTIDGSAPIESGDNLTIGGVDMEFDTISPKEASIQAQRRLFLSQSTITPLVTTCLLTVFQMLTVSSLIINRPEHSGAIATSFLIFSGVMWGYILFNFFWSKTGLEPEILAFFLCSLCLAVTASSRPESIHKQLVAILIGMAFFLALSWYLRSLKRVVKLRHAVAVLTCVLLCASLVFGTLTNGAHNWIYVMGISIQPSELAKVCFIFAGAASLERLFKKRNLWGFIGLSFFCFGALALMSDFGTAAIFFVTFLVIAYLRSGDFATLSLICCSAIAALVLVLKFKPYIAARFSIWGHAWDDVSGAGYQQVRTMSAAASGGMIGVGSGEGWLHKIAAANTDLVFGMICEEWGLIIGLLAILGIASLSIFTFRVVRSSRSSYYVIASCAAVSMLVFQTMLNVFGSLDMFPLTGVTFPFVSCGGSSMLASWGLLAFVKAADTRQGASFAVKKVRFKNKKRKPYRADREPQPVDDFFEEVLEGSDADYPPLGKDAAEPEPGTGFNDMDDFLRDLDFLFDDKGGKR